jgi:PACS-1 cytosolic sorting protein
LFVLAFDQLPQHRFNRVNFCLNSSPMQLPVAEAMVTYKEEKSTGEESSQVFLPFLSDVRVGSDVTSGTSLL